MKAGTPPDARRQRGNVAGLASLGSPGLCSRCLDGERNVCGPSFEPVLGVELGIPSEIEVSVAIRDGKEKPDLRPDPGNT
jgi:hypothetical protein